jgi:hypothetical protein
MDEAELLSVTSDLPRVYAVLLYLDMTIGVISSVLTTKGDEGVRNVAVSVGRPLIVLAHRVHWSVPTASAGLGLESI